VSKPFTASKNVVQHLQHNVYLSVLPHFNVWKRRPADFHEACYECYGTGEYPNVVRFNVIQTPTTVWRDVWVECYTGQLILGSDTVFSNRPRKHINSGWCSILVDFKNTREQQCDKRICHSFHFFLQEIYHKPAVSHVAIINIMCKNIICMKEVDPRAFIRKFNVGSLCTEVSLNFGGA